MWELCTLWNQCFTAWCNLWSEFMAPIQPFNLSRTCVFRHSAIYDQNHWNQRVVVKRRFHCIQWISHQRTFSLKIVSCSIVLQVVAEIIKCSAVLQLNFVFCMQQLHRINNMILSLTFSFSHVYSSFSFISFRWIWSKLVRSELQ